LDVVVQQVRHRTVRLALDADAPDILARRVRQAVLARLAQTQRVDVQGETDVLPRLEGRQAAAIERFQMEGGDGRALAYLARNAHRHELARLDALFAIHPRFLVDQRAGEQTIGLGPGIDQFRRSGIAEGLADRAEQVLADDRIVLGTHAQADVLLHDTPHHRG